MSFVFCWSGSDYFLSFVYFEEHSPTQLSIMNRILLFFLASLSFVSSVFAQDLIVLRSDEEIISKVTAIQKWHILYRPFSQLEGEEIKLPKAEISYILYQDGMKQYFSPEDLPPVLTDASGTVLPDSLYDADLYDMGLQHASEYYQKRAPFWGTLGATVFYPFAGVFTGLVTGVIVGAIPPNIDMDDVPDPALYQSNTSYAEGYRTQAHKNKIKEVAKGFGIGAGIQGIILIILLSTW